LYRTPHTLRALYVEYKRALTTICHDTTRHVHAENLGTRRKEPQLVLCAAVPERRGWQETHALDKPDTFTFSTAAC